ncbi:MAG: sterol desaturase family protein [Nitrospiraceae bacterium]|nr:sterol desaturase family protein [Nitrospiraceae bacterium]
MEITVRLAAFLGVFAAMGLWELLAPRRALCVSKVRRWWCNLSIIVVDSLVLRLAFPVAALEMAVLAQERQWGLLNNVSMPRVPALLLAVLLLDLAIYLQHVMFHALPMLWRFHRMHHTDRDLDVTSGLRFHPGEILLSMVIKIAAIVLIGPVPAAVIVFEIVLNATAMFNHGNVHLPLGLDRVMRCLVVTPDMHRVHHSIIREETDSNFGFNFPWWDRLFGTYRAQPREGHLGMTIGLREYLDERPTKLGWLLAVPFTRQA